MFTGKWKENFKKWFRRLWLHVTLSNFFGRIVRSEAFFKTVFWTVCCLFCLSRDKAPLAIFQVLTSFAYQNNYIYHMAESMSGKIKWILCSNWLHVPEWVRGPILLGTSHLGPLSKTIIPLFTSLFGQDDLNLFCVFIDLDFVLSFEPDLANFVTWPTADKSSLQ